MKEAKVKSYTRKTKSGKTITVKAHSRVCEGGSCKSAGAGREFTRKKSADAEKSIEPSKAWSRVHKATGKLINKKNRNFRDNYTVTPGGKVVRRKRM